MPSLESDGEWEMRPNQAETKIKRLALFAMENTLDRFGKFEQRRRASQPKDHPFG
jgi:hypothetical protein